MVGVVVYLSYRSAFIKLIFCPKQGLKNSVTYTSINLHNLKNVISSVYLDKAIVLHRSECIKNPFVFSDSEEKAGSRGKIQPVTSISSSHAMPSSMTTLFYLITSVKLTQILTPGVETSSMRRD